MCAWTFFIVKLHPTNLRRVLEKDEEDSIQGRFAQCKISLRISILAYL